MACERLSSTEFHVLSDLVDEQETPLTTRLQALLRKLVTDDRFYRIAEIHVQVLFTEIQPNANAIHFRRQWISALRETFNQLEPPSRSVTFSFLPSDFLCYSVAQNAQDIQCIHKLNAIDENMLELPTRFKQSELETVKQTFLRYYKLYFVHGSPIPWACLDESVPRFCLPHREMYSAVRDQVASAIARDQKLIQVKVVPQRSLGITTLLRQLTFYFNHQVHSKAYYLAFNYKSQVEKIYSAVGEIVKLCGSSGVNTVLLVVDVPLACAEVGERFVSKLHKKFKQLRIVFPCYGIWSRSDPVALSEPSIEEVLRLKKFADSVLTNDGDCCSQFDRYTPIANSGCLETHSQEHDCQFLWSMLLWYERYVDTEDVENKKLSAELSRLTTATQLLPLLRAMAIWQKFVVGKILPASLVESATWTKLQELSPLVVYDEISHGVGFSNPTVADRVGSLDTPELKIQSLIEDLIPFLYPNKYARQQRDDHVHACFIELAVGAPTHGEEYENLLRQGVAAKGTVFNRWIWTDPRTEDPRLKLKFWETALRSAPLNFCFLAHYCEAVQAITPDGDFNDLLRKHDECAEKMLQVQIPPNYLLWKASILAKKLQFLLHHNGGLSYMDDVESLLEECANRFSSDLKVLETYAVETTPIMLVKTSSLNPLVEWLEFLP